MEGISKEDQMAKDAYNDSISERNMLKKVECESFNVRSEHEIAEDMMVAHRGFDAIVDYGDDESPYADDIRTAERVIKYAAQCKGIGFSDKDAMLVMRCSTNILRWSLNLYR